MSHELQVDARKNLEEHVEYDADALARTAPDFSRYVCEAFRAEHGVVNNNIIVQFFLPEQAQNLRNAPVQVQRFWEDYWLQVFPAHLDPIARHYFKATSPRLVAKYTEELVSWWLQAKGFGDVLDPKRYAVNFLNQMQQALLPLAQAVPSGR